jgi:hypothetical protein
VTPVYTSDPNNNHLLALPVSGVDPCETRDVFEVLILATVEQVEHRERTTRVPIMFRQLDVDHATCAEDRRWDSVRLTDDDRSWRLTSTC